MNFNEVFEELNKLYENVSINNPYLAKALSLYKQDKDAKGIIVSYRDPNTKKEVEVCQTYHNQSELDNLAREYTDISAIHNRSQISYYEDEIEKIDSKRKNTERQENQAKTEEIFDTHFDKALKDANINLRKINQAKYRELHNLYIPEVIPAGETKQQQIIDKFIKILTLHKDELGLTSSSAQPHTAEKNIKKTNKYSAAQLTNMRKNNNKIITAAKEAGLDVSPLIATGTDKNGRQFKKASPELNKMRKTLFGESKKEDNREDWD